MQGLGATIQRSAIVELTKLDFKIIANQHDSITIETPTAQVEEQKKIGAEVMRAVSARYLGGNPIRVDAVVYADRFEEKSGREGWARIVHLLEKYE